MSVANALGFALQSINVLNRQINITSDNISNATNEDYNRRTVSQQNLQSGGVIISDVLRASNESLRRAENRANSAANRFNVTEETFQELENLLGTNFDSATVTNILQNFENGWRDFQATPELPGVERNLINTAEDFTTELQRINEGLLQIDVNLNRRVRETVDDLNQTLSEVAAINANIAFAQNNPDQVSFFRNELDPLISKLSSFLEIRTVQNDDGRIFIFNNNSSLVTQTAAQFRYDAAADTLTRSDVTNLDTDFSRRLSGGSLEALIQLKSRRPAEIASTDYKQGLTEKLRNQLTNIAYQFYHDGTIITPFSRNVASLTDGGPIVFDGSTAVAGGTLTLTVFDDANITVGAPVSFTVNNTSTVENLNAALNAFVSSVNGAQAGIISFDRTENGQYVINGEAGFPDGYTIRIQDTSGIFDSSGTIIDTVYDSSNSDPFALAYNSAETNSTRNELSRDFFQKAVTTDDFSIGNFRVNSQFTDNLSPPNVKRASPNAVVDSFVSQTNSVRNSGLTVINSTLRDTTIGFISNILAESRTVSDNQELNQNLVNQVRIDLRNDVGVNLDVELARLTTLQNAYNASARVIGIADQLLEALVNLGR